MISPPEDLTFITNGPPAAYARPGFQGYDFARQIHGPDATSWNRYETFFIEIPKTGSLSIQRCRDYSLGLGHIYGRYLPKTLRPRLRTIVRNPYDRCVSAYYFMIRGGFRNNPNYLRIRNDYDNFEDWVLRGLDESLTKSNPKFSDMEPTIAQFHWLIRGVEEEPYREGTWAGTGTGTGTGVNEIGEKDLILDTQNIGRFEILKEDAKRLFNIDELPHINKSTDKKHWTEYYQNPDVEDKVYRLYEPDFKLFGYHKYDSSSADKS